MLGKRQECSRREQRMTKQSKLMDGAAASARPRTLLSQERSPYLPWAALSLQWESNGKLRLK